MPGKALENIGKASNSIWSLLTLVGGVVLVVANCVFAWVQIESNTLDIKQDKIDTAKENQVRDDRSDKRYKRATEMAEEIHRLLIEHDKRLKGLEINQAVNSALDSQSRSELDNLWKNYNEELNKQIKKSK